MFVKLAVFKQSKGKFVYVKSIEQYEYSTQLGSLFVFQPDDGDWWEYNIEAFNDLLEIPTHYKSRFLAEVAALKHFQRILNIHSKHLTKALENKYAHNNNAQRRQKRGNRPKKSTRPGKRKINANGTKAITLTRRRKRESRT